MRAALAPWPSIRLEPLLRQDALGIVASHVRLHTPTGYRCAMHRDTTPWTTRTDHAPRRRIPPGAAVTAAPTAHRAKDPGVRHDGRSGDRRSTAAEHGRSHLLISAPRAGCAASSPNDPARYLDKTDAGSRRARAGRRHLHLPDAPGHAAGRARAACPICGMALEPEVADRSTTVPNPELADMTRRFWIGLALAAPVVVLEMGGHPRNRRIAGSIKHCPTSIQLALRDAGRCCGPAGRSSGAAAARSPPATSTCLR